MADLPTLLKGCKSPADLIALAGWTPAEVTSPTIATILDGMYGTRPRTKDDLARWRAVCDAPWPTRRARRTAVCIGRRGLKTTGIGVWALLFEALCRAPLYARYALPGARLRLPIVCPFVPQAAEALAALKGALGMLAPLGIAAEVRDERGSPEVRITSPAGRAEVLINVLAANEFSAVGYTCPFWIGDEAARFPTSGPSSLRAIARALDPAGSTFTDPACEAGSLWTSNKSHAEGAFYDAVQGDPKPGTLVIRAASWTTNPRMSRAHCLELCDGDEREMSVTYDGASPIWGYDGEGYIPTARIAVEDEYCSQGPRGGYFAVGLDVGQMQDSSAIVVVGAAETEIAPGTTPVRHLIVEHVESILSAKASKGAPPSIEMIVGRACDVARTWGNAPITCDYFSGVEVARVLERRGWSKYEGAYFPTEHNYVLAQMGPAAQTPRWALLRSLASGGRLHIPESGRELIRQLGQLTATTLASGSLKVEGRRDDLADALALAAEIAMKLPPNAVKGGAVVECIDDGIHYSISRGLQVTLPRFVKRYPNGNTEPMEIPSWHPAFERYARDMIAQGKRTRSIEEWEAAQPGPRGGGASVSIPVRHG
jgi:hypothetical protein